MSEVSREKVEAGSYRLVTEDVEVEVAEVDGAWIVRSPEGKELTRTGTLTDAESLVAQGEIEAEPVETVAWSIENNPNSVLHRTADGSTTLCGVSIPGDKELDAEPRGECGRCFK